MAGYWPQRTRSYFLGPRLQCTVSWKLSENCDQESWQTYIHRHSYSNGTDESAVFNINILISTIVWNERSVPVQSSRFCRKHNIFVFPDINQSIHVSCASFCLTDANVHSSFESVDDKRPLAFAGVDAEIAVDRVQHIYVHVVDEPHRPHVISRPAWFK